MTQGDAIADAVYDLIFPMVAVIADLGYLLRSSDDQVVAGNRLGVDLQVVRPLKPRNRQ